jgi:hypothetical protein
LELFVFNTINEFQKAQHINKKQRKIHAVIVQGCNYLHYGCAVVTGEGAGSPPPPPVPPALVSMQSGHTGCASNWKPMATPQHTRVFLSSRKVALQNRRSATTLNCWGLRQIAIVQRVVFTQTSICPTIMQMPEKFREKYMQCVLLWSI